MPLSSIVVIVIRLFALNWLLTSVPLLFSAATNPLPYERHLLVVLMPYAPAVLVLIFAAGLWILAPTIARFVSRGVDANVSIGSLSRSDLYSFAFVFLGLFSFCRHSQMSSTGFTISPRFPAKIPGMTRAFRTFISLLGLVSRSRSA